MTELKITSRELLSDGRTILRYDMGGSFTYPPLPDGDWRGLTAKTLCDIQYGERSKPGDAQDE